MLVLKIIILVLLAVATKLLFHIKAHGEALAYGRTHRGEYDPLVLRKHRTMVYLDLAIIVVIILGLEIAIRVIGTKEVHPVLFYTHLVFAVTFLSTFLVMAFYATGLSLQRFHKKIAYVSIASFFLALITGAYMLYLI